MNKLSIARVAFEAIFFARIDEWSIYRLVSSIYTTIPNSLDRSFVDVLIENCIKETHGILWFNKFPMVIYFYCVHVFFWTVKIYSDWNLNIKWRKQVYSLQSRTRHTDDHWVKTHNLILKEIDLGIFSLLSCYSVKMRTRANWLPYNFDDDLMTFVCVWIMGIDYRWFNVMLICKIQSDFITKNT